MMLGKTWTSPDGKIRKVVVVEGDWGKKPSEQSECGIKITDCVELEKYNNSSIIIGDNYDNIGRILDVCLMTMNEKEVANFVILPENLSFTVNLVSLVSNDLIHQWSVRKKLDIAFNHKEKGVELFKQGRDKDAAYRFTKALKLISSVPIDVENPPTQIDEVPIKEIDNLKANLFSNLASYYLKHQAWLMVIDLCKKVFVFDKDNVKAHYKIGVAYMKDRNFEQAEKEFEVVLQFEPDNKAARDNLKIVKEEIRKANVRFNMFVKRMFNSETVQMI